MKTLPVFFVIYYVVFCTSCQKSISGANISNGTDSTVTTDGTDTTISPPVTGPLLVRSVSYWKDSPTGPEGDSEVTLYFYDAAKFLIKKQLDGQPAVLYTRDTKERLTQISFEGGTAYAKVFYTAVNSSHVAYVLSANDATSQPDSMAFTYTNARVTKTSYYTSTGGGMLLTNYQTYSYDVNGNVVQLQLFVNGALNTSYDFEYDNKVNPFYIKDDARIHYEWGYVLSPNNITKQVNHYGSPPVDPDDYVTYTFVYNAESKPANSVHAGPAIGTQSGRTNYYYQ